MNATLTDLQQAPDAFALLGLPREYDMSVATVEQAFTALQQRLAPSITGGSADERAAADEILRRAGEARNALRDPYLRAETLLDIYGAEGTDLSAPPPGYHDTLAQLRGELTAALASHDEGGIAVVRERLMADRQLHFDHIAEIFSFPRNIPNAVAQTARDQTIRTELNAIRMVEQLLKEV